ncbi:MAG: NAD(P)H-hydrate dehydratase [Planctomycetia bacterium]|nr:NAD(P)H-hydrate dehydratase [Planctomycetia bacterium]
MPADAPPLPPLPPRPADAHKASVGRVLIVGGSMGMAGAPALAARGALRAGAGLVTVAVPRPVQAIVAGFLPEAMTVGLPCDGEGVLDASADEALRPHLERVHVVVVGPGLGRAPAVEDFVLTLARVVERPLVLDADALYALRGRLAELAARRAPTVLTPHEGEAAQLLGEKPGGAAAPREAWARRIAEAARGIAVLKGPGTLVCDGPRCVRNTTGGPVLATGGTGDVLAGVVAAMLAGLPATGGDAFGAACLAVHVHGRAGDRCAAVRGDRGTLASEVADEVPHAIAERVAAAPR